MSDTDGRYVGTTLGIIVDVGHEEIDCWNDLFSLGALDSLGVEEIEGAAVGS